MVNCALQKFRSKSHLHAVVNIDDVKTEYSGTENISSQLGTKELLQLVQLLPSAYRMVFNLYVFEGMKHREIAEMLGISEGTSKSNLGHGGRGGSFGRRALRVIFDQFSRVFLSDNVRFAPKAGPTRGQLSSADGGGRCAMLLLRQTAARSRQ